MYKDGTIEESDRGVLIMTDLSYFHPLYIL